MELSPTGCRCGQATPSKRSNKYISRKRCKCIVRFKTCSAKCKCAGSCGGVVCKSKVVKITKKMSKNHLGLSTHYKHRTRNYIFPIFFSKTILLIFWKRAFFAR